VRVTVSLQGRLAHEPQLASGPVELAEGAVAADVATACGLDPRACVVVVNGAAVTRSTELREGDRAALYPAQAGG
jgi:sulfur carrier protein ThiS